MVPSLLCFSFFHGECVNTQRKHSRTVSQEIEAIEINKQNDSLKKNTENQIEIVELAQTMSNKNTESPELQEALSSNYWQSVKNIMTSKVKSKLIFFIVFPKC